MKRKEFLKNAAAGFVFLNSMSVINLFSTNEDSSTIFEKVDLGEIDDLLREKTKELFQWMRENGWEDYLKEVTNQNSIPFDNDVLLCETFKDQLIISSHDGFDDFGGCRLIQPGNPSFSLLYHALASPRVKDSKYVKSYPSTEQLDTLENYIYALKKWSDYLQEIHSNADNVHFMVLAYEYRPAYKTPMFGGESGMPSFPKCAQLVFSRSGISRVGNCELNYDAISRSYTNKPKDPLHEKEIAVTPARFGLFLVELVAIKKETTDPVKILNVQDPEYNRHFIRPIRKIFNDNDFNIDFGQYHLNQKLYKFSQFKSNSIKIQDANINQNWLVTAPPFKRITSRDDKKNNLLGHNNDHDMVELLRLGSSVLLSSVPNDLIRVAKQNNKILCFNVEHELVTEKNSLSLTNDLFSDEMNAVREGFIYRKQRRTSFFGALRNAPGFANIKHIIKNDEVYSIALDENIETFIQKGDYKAVMFEDSMCDGCISVNITEKREIETLLSEIVKKRILPAFSIVCAPDFFPLIDSNDIAKYYNYYKNDREHQNLGYESIRKDEHFLKGGTLNLSGIRQRGNPDICDPFTNDQAFDEIHCNDKSFDTLVAVVSNNDEPVAPIKYSIYYNNFERDYSSNNFLPDSGTGIFYPGWDITYSGDKTSPYFATFGLGSPFPEDMKLCAAANGMWPVSSPDAGRTFQGSLKKIPLFNRPNTSIPLMDEEIGYHKLSPQVQHYKLDQSFGWDGEQGPFLKYDEKILNKLSVNFTDIGRADYVGNLLGPVGFDMSKLRILDSREMINRMDCLRLAIKKINHKTAQYTPYWLISAEKVIDWAAGAQAVGIPNNIVGNSNEWARTTKELRGGGFLFLFVLTKPQKLYDELESCDSKRRNQKVTKICVCKVSQATLTEQAKIEWCEITGNFPKSLSEIKWST